jgi:exosortase A
VSIIEYSNIKAILLQNKKLLAASLISILSVVIYYETWRSIVEIWIRSETFAHGFIIAPISLWLIWTKRSKLNPIEPEYAWLALVFILLNGLIWLMAELINALVIKQFAVVGLFISSLWFYLGNRITYLIIFPLLFLYLMVPFGEALFPYLMEFTANFTVKMLRLTGISVYQEGLIFTLPTGKWSVIEACSGLRYLIASATLGLVYAYINYSKFYKRLIFSLVAIIVPIIANGFRAYMIVMIGHLSDMKLAVGIDHVIYGAVFFWRSNVGFIFYWFILERESKL